MLRLNRSSSAPTMILPQSRSLPASASVGFVTGGQQANTTALAAARHHVLAGAGWDVEASGLGGAPKIRVVVGEERHVTIDRALRLLGLGASSIVVDRGHWQVCVDAHFEGRCVVLGPGNYDSLRGMGMDKAISSVRPVAEGAYYPAEAPPPVAYDYRRRPNETQTRRTEIITSPHEQ